MNMKVDVLMGANTRLVEDIIMFNKDCTSDLNSKFEADGKIFEKVEKSLFDLRENFSKGPLSYQASISQESIFDMVSTIELSFKIELAPILKLALRLPTNDPHLAHVSQGGEKELVYPKD